MTAPASRGDLSAVLDADRRRAVAVVDDIDPDVLLQDDPEVTIAAIVAGCRRDEVAIQWDAWTRSPVTETKAPFTNVFGHAADIPQQRITLTVPFTGDRQLLEYRASQRLLSHVDGEVTANAVVLTVTGSDLKPEQVQARFERWRDTMDKLCGWANRDSLASTTEMEQRVRDAVSRRRTRILRDRELDAALPIPLTPAPGTHHAPVPAKRRHLSIATRRDPNRPAFVPEPMLTAADYADIVSQCQNWARGLERTPKVAAKLDEEELRDHLLIALNMYWLGTAGAEMFNGAGKTDILVRERGRNVFIAECKIWRGAKAAGNAVDQLLSYLVWRDSKAALVMFVKNANVEDAIARLQEAVAAHPRCVHVQPADDPSQRQDYRLSADDEGRTVNLAVLPVALPPVAKPGARS